MKQSTDIGELFTHVLAIIIVLATVFIFVRTGEIPEFLLTAFGVAVGQYFNRLTTSDTLTQSERVLRANTEPVA